ncbi:MAG: pitrilysin family protein [Paracoccaceae bacterium]
MIRVIMLVTAFVLAALPLRAAEISSFTLDNGMDVVVIQDQRAPAVVHMVWYRVGSADEPAGKSGIAHFLEHLMFKGTDVLGPGEFSATVTRNGGSDNAFTSYDYTAYFQRITADRLGLMMEMEANRMRNLEMTESDVATERAVVLEERNQRTDNQPGALFAEQRNAAQYLNHPYGVPVVGWRHEIEALNRDDAFDFYHQYYAPNNAILIVAGDTTTHEVRELADRFYGPIAPNPDLMPRKRPSEPPQLAERRMRFADPRVSQPYVVRSYLAPPRISGAQQEAAALTLLAQVLGGSGATSVLGRKLQFEQQVALHVSASYSGVSLDDTQFGLAIIPAPDVTLADAEDALDAAIDEFMQTGIDPVQFARIKMQQRAAMIYADDNVSGLAHRYGAALTTGLSLADIEAWPDIIDAVTEDDVLAAARQVFDKRRAVTGWLETTAPEHEVSE